MGATIQVRGLSKCYSDFGARTPSLKGTALTGLRRSRRNGVLWALQDIDLDVRAGRTVGIIGPNGAGKSSLLRLIGGVGRPDAGSVHVEGRVGALLELGSGFHPELSGRENAILAVIVAGSSRREAVALLPDITAFSGLERFLDHPLRAYSTGMQARLAFAVAICVQPDLLLVDEVLAVGDQAFQRRCLERLERFHDAGVTIMLVSHDPALVRHLCDEVVWLQGGRIVASGPTRSVVADYLGEARPSSVRLGGARPPAAPERASIASVRLLDGWRAPCDELAPGEALVVEVHVRVPAAAAPVQLGVRIVRADDGLVCVDTSVLLGTGLDDVASVELLRLDLAPRRYDVHVGLYSSDWSETYDHRADAQVTMRGEGGVAAALAPPVVWRHPGGLT